MFSTKQNFMLGGAFFVAVFGLVAYQSLRTTTCADDSHTVLVLVDFTDQIGDDARGAMKDHVWRIIEAAPDFSKVIMRPVMGLDGAGQMMVSSPVQACRGEKPGPGTGFKGPAKKARESWAQFKSQICGATQGDALDLTCGHSDRGASFFDGKYAKSFTSPILEEITGNVSRFISTTRGSWDLVVATDWKQNTPNLNLESQSCDSRQSIDLSRIPTLVAPNEKPLSASDDQARKSTVTSLFLLRQSMTDAEANCLESRVAQRFLLTHLGPSSVVAPPVFHRLPRTFN